MRQLLIIAAALAAFLPADRGVSQTVAKEIFASYQSPSGSAAEPIGSYSRGCLAGGIALAETTDRWLEMRPSRNRNWGHPALISFVERLSGSARQLGWPGLYVGDLSQPRGGPMLTGHRSHQIGLDADIWLRRPERMDLSLAERETLSAEVMVAADGVSLNQLWTPEHQQLLKAAAEDPAVSRIFVHPAIKRGLCAGEPATDAAGREWLRKVRPWHGHNAHFHVRLACPDRSGSCTDQPLPPPGDGCGAELDQWLADDTDREEFSGTRGLGDRDVMLDELPNACRSLVASSAPELASAGNGTREQEITALYGITGSRYLWVLPLDRSLSADPALRFEATGQLPPGLAAASGQEGGLVIQGTPTLPGDFRFGIVGRDGGGIRARFAVAMTVEPGRAEDGTAAVQPVSVAPAPVVSAREQEVRSFLHGFQGGDCFYAHPVTVADASAEIEAFSYREAPIYELDAAFQAAMGFEATIGARLVGPGHCAALAFASQADGDGRAQPRITIDDVTLGVGGYLSGRIDTPAGMTSVMMIVDANGIVDVPAGGLRGSRQFSFRTPGSVGPHLLLAVASPGGNAVSAEQMRSDGPGAFGRLATQARSGSVSFAMRYFVVE